MKKQISFIALIFCLYNIYGEQRERIQNSDKIVCIEISFGHNNETKIWKGTIKFVENNKNCRFQYVNSNKSWRDGTIVNIDKDSVSWIGKARLEKVPGWAIYNNERTEGYSPEKDFKPYKPFRLMINIQVETGTVLSAKTNHGTFDIAVDNLNFGVKKSFLNHEVSVKRIFPGMKLTNMDYIHERYKYHGFPAISSTSDGRTYIAYSTYYEGMSPFRYHSFKEEFPDNFDYLSQPADGDRLNMMIEKDGKVIDAFPVTPKGRDIYDIAMITDKNDHIWLAWSERINENQDIYFTSIVEEKIGQIRRLTYDPGPDIHPALATNENGIWITWQGYRKNSFDILYMNLSGTEGNKNESKVGKTLANEWNPAIAVDSKDNIAIAWDTYQKGDYDVWYALLDKNGELREKKHVSATLHFEARPSVVFDDEDRLWVAYEHAGKNWGKDNGSKYFIDHWNKTEGLYLNRSIRMVCIQNGKKYITKNPVHEIIPKEKRCIYFYVKGINPKRYLNANSPNHYVNAPVLSKDLHGNICLVYKKNPDLKKGISGTTRWWSYFMTFNGKAWSDPILLYGSFGQMHEKPAITCTSDGQLKVVHAADRQGNTNSENADQYAQNLWMSFPETKANVYPYDLVPVSDPLVEERSAEAINEERDVTRIQNYRTTFNEKTYRILKGDSHRHSSFSGDGGADSEIEDSYRYAFDAASLDWFSNGDHDNGYNEYYWNITQKLVDVFTIKNKHAPLFGYERSVGPFDGHRNVLFDRRGIRVLPRVQYNRKLQCKISPDVELLYRYLDQFDGICISHTSATATAGTDWRSLNTKYEPVTEIYQGERMSAECNTCPRFDATIPYHPVNDSGFYRNALRKGHHLGIIASSDHISTHISYAMVYVESFSRENIMEGLKKRHTYGATDNIILDVKVNGHFMGDVIDDNKCDMDIYVHGTDKIKEIVVVKNNREIPLKHAGGKEIKIKWEDKNMLEGENYYYVRVLQVDGELAWGSPVWIKNDLKQ